MSQRWRKAAAHGRARAGGAGSTGVANGVKSLCWGFKLQGLTVLPEASAKSVAEFETFVCRLLFCEPGC
jgi:hypothetical protein